MSSGTSSRPGPAAVPLERGRAAGLLTGMIFFTSGFAAAALLVLAGYGRGTPGYLVAITIGLVGIGLIGFFYHRGTVPLPDGSRIWSPSLMRAVTEPLELPAWPVLVALHGLAAVGVVGNLVVPLLRR